MLLNFALFALNDRSDRTGAKPEARLYDAERLTDMQGVLAALADLETEYEIECERIEHWSRAEAMKQQLLADLDDRLQAGRAAYQEPWDKLNSGSHSAPRSGSTERHDQFQPDDGNLKLPV